LLRWRSEVQRLQRMAVQWMVYRAEIRAGELLAEMEKNKGARGARASKFRR
jgi:hypothetical protein